MSLLQTAALEATRAVLWTRTDTRNALLCSLVPGAVAATSFATFAFNEGVVKWWADIHKPKWSIENIRISSAVDLSTILPLGFSSYLVYKYGDGYTVSALSIYGINMFLNLVKIPLAKSRDLLMLCKTSVLVHITALTMAFSFYRIEAVAGLLVLPYTFWTGYHALLAHWIHSTHADKPKKDL
ncbi:unnamed protein product [Caenorhabditis auriculariae]|uniref:Uncharacterized protein n=1 Tax=Caenorhabditis auriculariae TaxID=2777116 RepID=A0A8S1HJI4_9PELO|nr:unnamed protein product [Caenorhabditis auriculariae]